MIFLSLPLKKKKEVLKKLKAIDEKKDKDALNKIQEIGKEWSTIGYVPKEEKGKVEEEYQKLLSGKMKSLGMDSGEIETQTYEIKIEGLKEIKVYDSNGKISDKKMVEDVGAPLIWARFMDLNNNEPFFCDRDGVKRKSMSDIGVERRVGYGWYSEAPNKVLKKYKKWKKMNFQK